MLRKEKPDYKLFIYPSSFEEGLKTAIDLNLYGITISTAIASKKEVQSAHQHGVRVTLCPVHSRTENLRTIRKNPDIIQTDNLGHLLKVLE